MLSFPVRTVDGAREYLRAERLRRPVRPHPLRIAAYLHGYQDDYIPHCAQISEGLQVGCTCRRRGVCAHAAALLMDFLADPERYQPLPYVLRRMPDAAWSWLIGREFAWQDVPEHPHPWRQPARDAAWPALARAFAAPPPRQWTAGQAYAMCADTHPSWMARHDWRAAFDHWCRQILTTRDEPHGWFDLLDANPALPLDTVWQTLAPGRRDLVPRIFSGLGDMSSPPSPPRILALLHVLTLALGRCRLVSETWQAYRIHDPHGQAEGEAWLAADCADLAVAAWEAHLPQEAVARHAVRGRIIAQVPQSERLPYALADCLENPGPDCLEDLKPLLTEVDWLRMRDAILRRQAELDGAPTPPTG